MAMVKKKKSLAKSKAAVPAALAPQPSGKRSVSATRTPLADQPLAHKRLGARASGTASKRSSQFAELTSAPNPVKSRLATKRAITTKARVTRPAASKLTPSLELLLATTSARLSDLDSLDALSARGFSAAGLASAGMGIEAANEPMVHLFVNCVEGTAATLPGGVELHGQGEVRTAMVPLSGIEALIGLQQITRVSAPRQLDYMMDVARPLVRVPQFQAQVGKGLGVIVGVVDSGIDASHPAFAGRILALWDQTMPGPGPGGTFVRKGALLTGAQMGASVDTVGHGTHVAGIAAGAGAGSAFEGVAPEAELFIVKTTMANSDISEGARWVFAQAQALGRPAVVNLSLGGHMDGHDGRDDLSRALDGMCGAGRIVVAAAGNEGEDEMHSKQNVAVGAPAAFEVKVEPKTSGLALPYFLLSGWYSGAGKCQIRLVSSLGTATAWQAVGAAPSTTVLGHDSVNLVSTALTAGNSDRQFLVQVTSQAADRRVQGGTWRLEVKRSSGTPGTVHLWLLRGGARRQAVRLPAPTFSVLIGSPGAASQVVTVASYTSRNAWTNAMSASFDAGMHQDTVSPFSSPGPLRDGGLKPDVTAPGAMIVSCESAAWGAPQASKDRTRVAAGWRVEAGTSMATPFVAGVLACLMKSQPMLTPQQAKAWLRSRSRVPGLAAGTHDSQWGFGMLRI